MAKFQFEKLECEEKPTAYKASIGTSQTVLLGTKTMVVNYEECCISDGWYFNPRTSRIMCNARPVQVQSPLSFARVDTDRSRKGEIDVSDVIIILRDGKKPTAAAEDCDVYMTEGDVQFPADARKAILPFAKPSEKRQVFVFCGKQRNTYSGSENAEPDYFIRQVFQIQSVDTTKTTELKAKHLTKISCPVYIVRDEYTLTPEQTELNYQMVLIHRMLNPPTPIKLDRQGLFSLLKFITTEETTMTGESDDLVYTLTARKRKREE